MQLQKERHKRKLNSMATIKHEVSVATTYGEVAEPNSAGPYQPASAGLKAFRGAKPASSASTIASKAHGGPAAREMTRSSAAGSRASGVQDKGPMTRDPSRDSQAKSSFRRRHTQKVSHRAYHLAAQNMESAATEVGRLTDVLIPKLQDEISRLEKDWQESL